VNAGANWKLREAREHFDEVIQEALTHGPQTIELDGGREVVLALRDNAANGESKPPVPHLAKLFLNSPLKGLELEFPRMNAEMRPVDFGE
jgi:hypothetical protein